MWVRPPPSAPTQIPSSHSGGLPSGNFRLALTEDQPPIKTYEEAQWAQLQDAATLPVEVSLTLLDALHRRWTVLLESLDDAAFQREVRHPESGVLKLDTLAALYAWHSRHHVAHITRLRERMGWS